MTIRQLTGICFVALTAGNIFAQTNPVPAGAGERIEGFTDTPMLPGGKWHQHDPELLGSSRRLSHRERSSIRAFRRRRTRKFSLTAKTFRNGRAVSK